nr:hypothetical protein [Tanacetum cinerariifolium]
MEQSQRPVDVHQDELCPLNKRYALMDANKKVDLENPLCPDESKILANILQNHPLRFRIAASSSVPWIYLGHLWHTLQENGSKYKLKLMLDRKELTLTLDDFKTIFTYLKLLTTIMITLSLLQSSLKCYDQPSLQIMQMLYCFVNNIHVDYAELLWEGKSKNVVGMKISDWMITDEMKLTDNYRLYAEVFGVDVPTTQSQLIESTQGMHRITKEEESADDDYELKRRKFNALAKNLKDIMMESLLKLVDGRIKKILQTQVPLHVTQEIILEREKSQSEVAKMIVDAIQLIHQSGVICQDMYFIYTPLKLHQLLHMNNNNINYIDYEDNSQLQHDDLPIWLTLKYKFERLYMATNPCRPSDVRYRYQDDPHDDARPEGKNSAKRQKTYKDETFVFGESSSRQ